jgi:hypothetical protein
MRRPTKCNACGHRGGALTLTAPVFEDEQLDAAATASGIVLDAEWWCSGTTFADDGPTACLRRMTAKSFR